MSKKSSLANYDSVKKLINSLLLTYRNGLHIRTFEKLYEENILEKIPYRELGYYSSEEFFTSMPDAVDAIYSRDGVMILKAKCNASNAHLKNLIDQQKSNPPLSSKGNRCRLNQRSQMSQNSSKIQCFRPPRKQIPEWSDCQSKKITPFPAEIKDRLCILISKYPSGLDSEDLLKTYYHQFKDLAYQNDLSYKDYGFKSCEELFLSLLDIFTIEKLNSKLFFYPIKSLAKEVIQNGNKELDSNKVINENFTSVSIEDFYFYIDGGPYPFAPVSIGEVYGPCNFTLIVNGSALDMLMEEMQEFYVGEILNKWKLCYEHMVINQPVVALYTGIYTRAVITAFNGLDKVEVLYIDYGTTDVVSKSKLLYLHTKFFILPSQGISAKFYGIEPTTGAIWKNCKEISERFLNLVNGKATLFAEIIETELHPKKLSIRILDTEDDKKDVCINDLLVSEGFAQSTVSHSVDDGLSDSLNNCKKTTFNEGEINERISSVDKWLQHLPNSSSISSLTSPQAGLTMDTIMHIDAACQSIYDKRVMLLSRLSEDVDNDADAHALIRLNTCVRALKHVRSILDEVEK